YRLQRFIMEADDERIAALHEALNVAFEVEEINAEVLYRATSPAVDGRSEIDSRLLRIRKGAHVVLDDLRRAPVLAHLAAFDPDRSGTEVLDRGHVMGDKQSRSTLVA